MIKLKNVTKTIKVDNRQIDILKNINLQINEHDFVVITGASGSGKSTLLNIIGGLDSYSEGLYSFDGYPIQNEHDRMNLRRKDIAMIVQNFALIPNLSVIENIDLAQKDHAYADELLKLLGIFEQKRKKVKYLSGGEKQKVAIIRALIKRPRVLLADEPTGALDSKNSQEIVDLLFELNKQGLAIVLVTHNDEIAKLIDKHYVISDGNLA